MIYASRPRAIEEPLAGKTIKPHFTLLLCLIMTLKKYNAKTPSMLRSCALYFQLKKDDITSLLVVKEDGNREVCSSLVLNLQFSSQSRQGPCMHLFRLLLIHVDLCVLAHLCFPLLQDFFQDQLKKHGDLIAVIRQNLSAQDGILL